MGLPILSAAYMARIESSTPEETAGDKKNGKRSRNCTTSFGDSSAAGAGTTESAVDINARRGRRQRTRRAPPLIDTREKTAKSISPEVEPHFLVHPAPASPHSTTRTMTVKTYSWISLWFLITAPVIAWDVGYCFMRPRSMEGGDLHWLWSPYSIYQRVYGIPALEEGDGFTNAQSLMNVLETLLNLFYLYTAHVSAWPPAPLIGFTAASLTLAKTILYWAQEYFCNYCAVGHNSLYDLTVYWLIPNGFWIVVPTLIVWQLGKDLVGSLNLAHAASVKAASGKKN
ncbi:hypothetical protein R3P38DRAFT_2957741 [Favolaschia claudopus]|uniref:EXPERA domain-containing protein n=1 Tax=Favolaschia claudopus TaxID=2862362 RepID=A0AAW0BBG9_9AGAR